MLKKYTAEEKYCASDKYFLFFICLLDREPIRGLFMIPLFYSQTSHLILSIDVFLVGYPLAS